MNNGSNNEVPVITIDGWAGAGKGETRKRVAEILGFHQVDSGLVYRAIALSAFRQGIDSDDIVGLAKVGERLNLEALGDQVYLDGKEETKLIRSGEIGSKATAIGGIPEVREIVLGYKNRVRLLPGLVVDGRVGGFEFEGNVFRIFLIALPSVRAERRVREFLDRGQQAEYNEVLKRIQDRDRVDMYRKFATLEPHSEAIVIDTSYLTKDEVSTQIVDNYHAYCKKRNK